MSKIQLADLSYTIECMEDKSFNSSVLRSKNYSDIINVLHDAPKVDVKMAEKLLNICLMDFIEDLQYTSSNMMIISLILKKVKVTNNTINKEGKCKDYQKLLQLFEKTAWAIVELTKKLLNKSLLRKLAIDTLLQHPDEVLRAVVTDHMQEVVDLIDYYPRTEHQSEVTEKMISIVAKFLKILPPVIKLEFVKCGLKAWFNSVIPGVMTTAAQEDTDLLKRNIEVLELLVEELDNIDYAESSFWQPVLKDICTPNKYPAILKKLIETHASCWHRMWMIFIKLLKGQITKVNKSGISPINALLPVVEWAFKLDPVCRSRAFECWNVLIDNFSSEQNEALINKRLKLLIIPLKLNNAKVPETILAKFNTWWHLIRRFQSKMDKHIDTVMIPFLRFCFGKSALQVLTPGLISDEFGKKCVEALVEIIGHVDCEGCVTLPRLDVRFISTKLLVDHWTDWVHALSVAIRLSSRFCCETDMKRVRCLWKGFVLMVAELPANQIRADLFVELLKLVESLKRERINGDIIFNILIGSLFDYDDRVRQLLKTKGGEGPVHVIIRILNSSDMNYYYKELKPEEAIAKLKPIMTLFMDPSYTHPDEIVRLWMKGFYETKLILWAALAEAICESKHELVPNTLHEFVEWPFNIPHKSAAEESLQIMESEAVWYKWFTLYSYVHPMKAAKFDETIMALMRPGGNFSLLAPIALLKQQLNLPQEERLGSLDYHTDSLLKVLERVEDFKSLEKHLPIFIDTLVLLLENAIKPKNFNVMQKAVSSVTTLLKHVNEALKSESNVMDLTRLDHLMIPIAAILQSEKCLAKVLITPLIDELCSFALNISKHPNLKKELLKILQLTLSIYHKGTYMSNKVTNTIKTVQNDEMTPSRTITMEEDVCGTTESSQSNKNQEQAVNVTEKNRNKNSSDKSREYQNTTEAPQTTHEIEVQDHNKNDFPTPIPKSVKKAKKKEPNIVDTVVENGEEFVVVKSHWKFNPKKLTENQREKLKRKREDIPALYQDLSQSQDEFKLTTWKTDSQDASTTTSSKSESNSKTNEDVTNILKNIPSTEVVPKIIENIFPDSTNKHVNIQVEKPAVKKTQMQKTPISKDPKTPRLALKDRVFRNVRNLMEKSGTQSASKAIAIVVEDMNQTLNENNLKTPVIKVKPISNVTNSAPPKISAERPLRVIKKPKKFENTEMFALKKIRRSQGSSQSDSPPENETDDNIENATKTNEVICDNSAPNDGGEIVENHENPELPKIETQLAEISTERVIQVQDSKEPNPQNYENIDQNNENPVEMNVVLEAKIKDTPVEQVVNNQNDDRSQLIEEIATPKPADKRKDNKQSTIKKKRSRIEKQLLIDMVEGHPLLQSQSEKRSSRKNQVNEPKDSVSKRRKSLIEKSNKIKAELESVGIIQKKKNKTNPKAAKTKNNEEQLSQDQSQPITIIESQDTLPESSSTSEDQPMSEDVIESSQDSSITTISMKSTSSKKRVPIVMLDKENPISKTRYSDTQKLLDEFKNDIIALSDSIDESKDDIELPKNQTAVTEEKDLTEDMDTEPMASGDVILVNDEVQISIVINTEDTAVGKDTQELAEADTLPMEVESQIPLTDDQETNNTANHTTVEKSQIDNDISHVPTEDNITPTMSGTAEVINDIIQESSNTGSPSRDEFQRKKEFLNDTIEISPIKTLSPIKEDKAPSPETSDYVLIKFATPVQSNGEPFSEKCDSPEIFTEDKVSPDKRDQSPPRKEITNNNISSPSSSLSLKKNRPQMRFNGRAAQMLELCVSNSSRSENEEPVKRSSPVSTPARRNLRNVYNTENTECQETSENEENENFLKFTRALPTNDCSPSGPILKRKLAEIADEATVSPASKRKRVSFHDPPVSTTVAVQKYIEPGGIRSPSNSAIKRLERQTRVQTCAKSPKRLENSFRLETVLTKAVESFSDETTVSNDTEISLEETPAVEIIKTSELNDKDPICSELLDCEHPIETIAGELSSPSTKALLIKELEGKVETIADLAKMTELEVNRLCIKAPKVKIAKKVLTDYAAKRAKTQEISNAETPTVPLVRPPQVERVSTEVQTNEVPTRSSEMQTVKVATSFIHTQTDGVATSHCGAQTNETGSKSTKDVIALCLTERSDFVNQLTTQLDESSVKRIAETCLPVDAALTLLMDKMTAENAHNVLNCVLTQSKDFKGRSRGLDLKLLQDYLCDRFDSKDLILFCSELLQKVHDKPI